MIKQTLFFTTPVLLSLKYNQIEIRYKDGDYYGTRVENAGFPRQRIENKCFLSE